MTLRVYGNRALKTLPGNLTRPTPARVREALFNIWQGEIADCQWLDLCSGSGAMGAEALARGAKLVVGIEQSSRACTIIRQNWQKVAQADQHVQLLRGDIQIRLKQLHGKTFDRIYFDPPYASSLYQPVLGAIAHLNLLAPDGELAVEHAAQDWHIEPIVGLSPCRERTYGNVGLTFYRPSAQILSNAE